ncbi:MAG: hypothetical protein AAF456_18970 [Planctomycetota bacterium]
MNSMRTLLSFAIALSAFAVLTSGATAQDEDQSMTEYASFQIEPALDPGTVVEAEEGNSEDERRFRNETREIEARIRNFKRLAVDHLEGSGSEPTGLSQWFTSYLFAQMTQTDNESLSQLGTMREAFFKTYLSDRISQRQKVLNITIQAMQAIVENQSPDGKPFHPAVRMNAVTVIGMLDTQRPDTRNMRLPQPMTEARTFLLTVYNNPAYPPHIRVGAMAGLKRHFEIDNLGASQSIPQAEVNAFTTECIRLAGGAGTATDDWSADGTYWMQRLAVQTLGSMKRAGSQAGGTEVMDVLAMLAENPDMRDMLRYDAIDALGKLRYSGVPQDSVDRLPAVLGSYLASVARQESAHLRWTLTDFIEKNILFGDQDFEVSGNVEGGGGGNRGGSQRQMGAGGGAGGGLLDEGGGTGGGGNNDDDEDEEEGPRVEIANYHLTNSRRRVKVIALRVKDICENVSPGSGSLAARAADKALLSEIAEKAGELISESDIGLNDSMDDEDDPLADNGLPEEDEYAYESTALDMADVFDRSADSIESVLPAAAGGGSGNEFGGDAEPANEFEGNF